jgi:anti-anti-sigma regulatory factor
LQQRGSTWIVEFPMQLGMTSEDLVDSVIGKASKETVRKLILDFTKCQTMDSAGIGLVLLIVRKGDELDAELIFAGLEGQPRLLMERSRLTEQARVVTTISDALSGDAN